MKLFTNKNQRNASEYKVSPVQKCQSGQCLIKPTGDGDHCPHWSKPKAHKKFVRNRRFQPRELFSPHAIVKMSTKISCTNC